MIDLRFPEESSWIKKVNKFPDGQITIELIPLKDYYTEISLIIGHTWNDVQVLLATVAALPKSCIRKTLIIPYLIGGRSDRQFTDLSTHYLRDVIAPIINSLSFQEVLIEVPHSDVSCAVIHNSTPVFSNFIYNVNKIDCDVIVYPDIGAYKRFHGFFDKPSVVIGKYRDEKGKVVSAGILSGLHLLNVGTRCLIVDDICDGGATFIKVADSLVSFRVNLELYVHHGMFSLGLDRILTKYNMIYTSNSICTIKHPLLTILKNF